MHCRAMVPDDSTPALGRVLLVTSDPLVRAGLAGLLAGAGTVVTIEPGAPVDAVAWDTTSAPPPPLGPGAPPVLALVQGEQDARAALAAGAAGAVLRSADGSTLRAALSPSAGASSSPSTASPRSGPRPSRAPSPAPSRSPRGSARCCRSLPAACPTGTSPMRSRSALTPRSST